jgi:hypothetical protein
MSRIVCQCKVAGLLRAGNAGPAAQAKAWIPRLVEQAERDLCCKARVRLDAGFTDGAKRGPGRPYTRPREWLEETTE